MQYFIEKLPHLKRLQIHLNWKDTHIIPQIRFGPRYLFICHDNQDDLIKLVLPVTSQREKIYDYLFASKKIRKIQKIETVDQNTTPTPSTDLPSKNAPIDTNDVMILKHLNITTRTLMDKSKKTLTDLYEKEFLRFDCQIDMEDIIVSKFSPGYAVLSIGIDDKKHIDDLTTPFSIKMLMSNIENYLLYYIQNFEQDNDEQQHGSEKNQETDPNDALDHLPLTQNTPESDNTPSSTSIIKASTSISHTTPNIELFFRGAYFENCKNRNDQNFEQKNNPNFGQKIDETFFQTDSYSATPSGSNRVNPRGKYKIVSKRSQSVLLAHYCEQNDGNEEKNTKHLTPLSILSSTRSTHSQTISPPIQFGHITTFLPIPSADWQDISDIWFCHNDDETIVEKRRDIFKLTPNIALFDSQYIILHSYQCVPIQIYSGQFKSVIKGFNFEQNEQNNISPLLSLLSTHTSPLYTNSLPPKPYNTDLNALINTLETKQDNSLKQSPDFISILTQHYSPPMDTSKSIDATGYHLNSYLPIRLNTQTGQPDSHTFPAATFSLGLNTHSGPAPLDIKTIDILKALSLVLDVSEGDNEGNEEGEQNCHHDRHDRHDHHHHHHNHGDNSNCNHNHHDHKQEGYLKQQLGNLKLNHQTKTSPQNFNVRNSANLPSTPLALFTHLLTYLITTNLNNHTIAIPDWIYFLVYNWDLILYKLIFRKEDNITLVIPIYNASHHTLDPKNTDESDENDEDWLGANPLEKIENLVVGETLVSFSLNPLYNSKLSTNLFKIPFIEKIMKRSTRDDDLWSGYDDLGVVLAIVQILFYNLFIIEQSDFVSIYKYALHASSNHFSPLFDGIDVYSESEHHMVDLKGASERNDDNNNGKNDQNIMTVVPEHNIMCTLLCRHDPNECQQPTISTNVTSTDVDFLLATKLQFLNEKNQNCARKNLHSPAIITPNNKRTIKSIYPISPYYNIYHMYSLESTHLMGLYQLSQSKLISNFLILDPRHTIALQLTLGSSITYIQSNCTPNYGIMKALLPVNRDNVVKSFQQNCGIKHNIKNSNNPVHSFSTSSSSSSPLTFPQSKPHIPIIDPNNINEFRTPTLSFYPAVKVTFRLFKLQNEDKNKNEQNDKKDKSSNLHHKESILDKSIVDTELITDNNTSHTYNIHTNPYSHLKTTLLNFEQFFHLVTSLYQTPPKQPLGSDNINNNDNNHNNTQNGINPSQIDTLLRELQHNNNNTNFNFGKFNLNNNINNNINTIIPYQFLYWERSIIELFSHIMSIRQNELPYQFTQNFVSKNNAINKNIELSNLSEKTSKVIAGLQQLGCGGGGGSSGSSGNIFGHNGGNNNNNNHNNNNNDWDRIVWEQYNKYEYVRKLTHIVDTTYLYFPLPPHNKNRD